MENIGKGVSIFKVTKGSKVYSKLTINTPFSDVSFVDFEQVNVCWVYRRSSVFFKNSSSRKFVVKIPC